jgi:hypothetical protein
MERATVIRAALIMLALLVVPASAGAQAIDPETQANFDRAASYWEGETLLCIPSEHPKTIVNQAIVFPNAALGQQGTCNIWVGDSFSAATPGRRCGIIVHEWGHLTGHPDGSGQPDDPLNVMGSDAMPVSCASLDPAPAVAAPPVPAALVAKAPNLDNDFDYVRWATQRARRADCRANADMKRHRPARVAARLRCIQRYGRIGHMPPLAR